MNQQRLKYLIEQYIDNAATVAERHELEVYFHQETNGDLFSRAAGDLLEQRPFVGAEQPYIGLAQRVLQMDKLYDTSSIDSNAGSNSPDSKPESEVRPALVHPLRLLKRHWFKYAAVAILLLGTAAYYWNNSTTTEQPLTRRSEPLTTDLAPGSQRAVLTLSDGRTIALDSASIGHLANQSGADILKLDDGQIAYRMQGHADKELTWNTMSTPRGGQYRLVLPDGTNVWLNAASSITYPAVFTGEARMVKITGEVYFEVTKDKDKTFLVDIEGKSTVQVLGTSFNVNSYSDYGSIETTLVEGIVKVIREPGKSDPAYPDRPTKPSGAHSTHTGSVVLKPGQQAKIPIHAIPGSTEAPFQIISDADVDQVLGWKNGLFNFNGLSLKEAIPQLERWYDIQVRYEGAIPTVKFKGRMNRGVKISTILNWFSELGIKTKLEGRTLIVLNSQ